MLARIEFGCLTNDDDDDVVKKLYAINFQGSFDQQLPCQGHWFILIKLCLQIGKLLALETGNDFTRIKGLLLLLVQFLHCCLLQSFLKGGVFYFNFRQIIFSFTYITHCFTYIVFKRGELKIFFASKRR